MTSNCGSQERPFEDMGLLEMDLNDGSVLTERERGLMEGKGLPQI